VGGRGPAGPGGKLMSMDAIERYNVPLDHWQTFAKLRTARHDAACAAVG